MSKAEHPEWACLCFRERRLEATVLQIEDTEETPETRRVEGEPAEALAQWTAEVPKPRQFALAVPTRDVLMMVTDLPTADADDIRGMVELQAEEVSPFAMERTRVAWEVLRQLEEGGTRVLMALMARDRVEAIHDVLYPVTGLPARVDVEIMGWLQILQVNGHLSSGEDTWVLVVTDDDAQLVAWHDETPVLIRSLGNPAELTAETVNLELEHAGLNVETAFPRARMRSLRIWHAGEAPEWLRGVEATEVRELDPLPPATRGVLIRSRLGSSLDLTPERWKQEEASRRNRRKILRGGIGVAAVWVLLLGALAFWTEVRSRRVEAREARNLARTDAVAEVRRLADQVRSLSQFTDRSRGALEGMRILAEAAPGIGVLQLEDFRYRKGDGLVFSGGTGGDVQPFYRFLDRMAGQDTLRVEDYDLQQTRNGYEFRLEADWQWGGE